MSPRPPPKISLLGQTFSWIKQVYDEFEQQRNRNSRRSARRICVKTERKKILHADRRQKQKTQRREPAGSSPKIVPIERRNWIDIEPGKYSLSEYEVSKKVIYLLRHSQKVHREEDGAVHFWRMKENLQNQFPHSIYSLVWRSMESMLGSRRWSKKAMAREMGPQGRSPTGGGGLARVPNLRVCKHLYAPRWHTQGWEGWINILPWYRLVGVAKNLQWDAKEEEPGCPQG